MFKWLFRTKTGKFFTVMLLIGMVLLSMACSFAPLTVGCSNGPYNWDKDRPGGTNGGECQDASGNPVVADCCCFVASASGLSHEQITTLRIVRDWMLVYVPGFTKFNDLYHTVIGPETANYLRANPWAKNISHNILVPVSEMFHLFVK